MFICSEMTFSPRDKQTVMWTDGPDWVPRLLALQGVADLEPEEEDEMEDSGEVLEDSSSSPSSTLKNYPLTCKVLYSYKVRAQEQACSGGGNCGSCQSEARSHKRETLGTAHSLKLGRLDPNIGSDVGFQG